ncbi:MAG: hypothetical protein KGJ80_16540, partial [Chloroflexota bacterium]|nr:hypothetical protein [Chloroflexota bacterium]
IITEQHAGAVCDRARALVHFDGGEPYDVAKYTELLLRAVETVLAPLGTNYRQIEAWVKGGIGQVDRAPLAPPQPRVWLGPLFEFAARKAEMKRAQR